MSDVKLFHWNPWRPIVGGRAGRYLPLRRRVNNFGDLLGPMIVRKLLASHEIDPRDSVQSVRLLTVGSVLHFAAGDDVIWGTGVNGKSLSGLYDLNRLDLRAVRGPRTARFLDDRGVTSPLVFGDPGLLIGHLWTREYWAGKARRRGVTILPNLHDWRYFKGDPRAINPRMPVKSVLEAIATSDLVVGSSLHGVVVAESMGIPARVVRSTTESELKYHDYFEGTGRKVLFAETVNQAIALGGQGSPLWDPHALVRAFPFDLWERASSVRTA